MIFFLARMSHKVTKDYRIIYLFIFIVIRYFIDMIKCSR